MIKHSRSMWSMPRGRGPGRTLVLVGLLAGGCGTSGQGADSGAPDGRLLDAVATGDGALVDGALVDGALVDGALVDGALADGALADGALADSAVSDAASPDGAVADGALADSAVPDAASPDSAAADASLADAAPDADGPDAAGGPVTPWTELVAPTVSLAGGMAPTRTGHGQPGGTLHLVTRGGITFDANAIGPPVPLVPTPPVVATRPTSLASDLSAPGAVVIDGTLVSSGLDPVRAITAVGDIFIVGTLAAGDQGATRQQLRLTAGGNVYVVDGGAIDASGAGPGQRGGGVELVGRQVVIVGRVASAGGGGAGPGAAAGAVTLRASTAVVVTGVVDAAGGDAHGPVDVQGGGGGQLTVQVGGDLTLTGTVRVRGGAASSTAGGAAGGPAGDVVVNADGAVLIGGVVDARGGLAGSAGLAPVVVGGAAGALRVGESARPTRVDVLAATDASGGAGGAVGGDGGTVLLQPHAGDLRIATRLEASGGGSAGQPGAGGHVDGNPGPDTATVTNAGVVVTGRVVASGGAMAVGGSGDGGRGGVIKLVVLSSDGQMTVTSTGSVEVDGGPSAAAGVAGPGGLAYLFTRDGSASISGRLLARGGVARDVGGTGGTGGLLYVFTDNNHGGPGPGVLVIEATGILDASGGVGTIGGSARNDGGATSVAAFPVVQTDVFAVEQIAVLINSDGVHGGATGWIVNLGLILARGGHANASGGDVFFHGSAPGGVPIPIPGRIDDAGDGTGLPGTFGGKHIIIVGPTF